MNSRPEIRSPADYCVLNPAAREQNRLNYTAWYKGHKEERRVYNAEWRKSHKEEKRVYQVAYRKGHRKKARLYSAEYRKDHLPEIAAGCAARRALILGATLGDLASIKEVYRQAKEDEPIRCYLCGELIPLGRRQVDHVHPLSKGGKHTVTNLKIACNICNNSKGSKMPKEVEEQSQGRGPHGRPKLRRMSTTRTDLSKMNPIDRWRPVLGGIAGYAPAVARFDSATGVSPVNPSLLTAAGPMRGFPCFHRYGPLRPLL